MATVQQQLAKATEYGWMLAVLRSDPDLSRLFDQAVAADWDGPTFIAKLRGTRWYRTRSESVRQALVLQKVDPAEYNRRIQQMKQVVADQYYAMTGRAMTDGTAAILGRQAFTFGFTDNEIRDMVGNTAKSQTLMMQGGLGGTLGDAERQLRRAADDYGLDLPDSYIAGQLNDIARQKTDVTAVLNRFRQWSKQFYSAYANQIDQGETIKDIAEPFRQQMAKTLELSDKSIAIKDRLIQEALTFKGADGKPAGMTMWQFQQRLQDDPRWLKTQNAQDSMMGVGRKVLQDLGMIAPGE